LVFWKLPAFAGRWRNESLGRRASGGTTPGFRGSTSMTNQGARESFEEGRLRHAGPSLRNYPARGDRKVFVTRCCAGRSSSEKRRGFRESLTSQDVGTRGKRKGSAAKRYPGRARIEISAVSRARGSCRVADFGKRRFGPMKRVQVTSLTMGGLQSWPGT